MIFRYTWRHVLDGSKTETRRPAGPRDIIEVDCEDRQPKGFVADMIHQGEFGPEHLLPLRLEAVRFENGRLRWEVGRRYAIAPGRGKHGIGHFWLRELLLDRLGNIDREGALEEGVQRHVIDQSREIYRFTVGENQVYRGDDPVRVYLAAWTGLYPKATADDPVFILRWDPSDVVRV